MEADLIRRSIAEAIGTFALVFVGTGAIVVNHLSGGAITHLGVALCFGLVVMTMIYAVGDVSGAHLNPAVSLGFWIAKRLSGRDLTAYISAQITGAVLASSLLRALFSVEGGLGITRPLGGFLPAFVMEMILTFFLMFVILGVATGAKEKGIMAGVAVGAVICFASTFGGPISGASLNPARSLGPALLTGVLGGLWLYFLAPFFGAVFAVGACRLTREPGCCQ